MERNENAKKKRNKLDKVCFNISFTMFKQWLKQTFYIYHHVISPMLAAGVIGTLFVKAVVVSLVVIELVVIPGIVAAVDRSEENKKK